MRKFTRHDYHNAKTTQEKENVIRNLPSCEYKYLNHSDNKLIKLIKKHYGEMENISKLSNLSYEVQKAIVDRSGDLNYIKDINKEIALYAVTNAYKSLEEFQTRSFEGVPRELKYDKEIQLAALKACPSLINIQSFPIMRHQYNPGYNPWSKEAYKFVKQLISKEKKSFGIYSDILVKILIEEG